MERFPSGHLQGSRARSGPIGEGRQASLGVPMGGAPATVDRVADLMLVTDAGGRVVNCNQAYREWAGLGEARGQFIADLALFPPAGTQSREGAREAVWQSRDWSGSYWVPDPSGGATRKFLKTRISAVGELAGESRGFVVVARDETPVGLVQAAAVQRRAGEGLCRVASFLHHEMANPLTTIMAAASMLSLPKDIGDQPERCVVEMKRGVEKLGQVLALLRRSARTRDFEPQEISVATVFRKAEVLVGEFCAEQGIAVNWVEPTTQASWSTRGSELKGVNEVGREKEERRHTRSAEPDSLMVLADLEALTRVLLFLVENAVEQAVVRAMGSVAVTAVARPDCVLIEVADSCGGVALQDQHEMFAAFYTTKGATRGLGLTTARSLVTGMSGLIEAHNNDVGGLSVTIRLVQA